MGLFTRLMAAVGYAPMSMHDPRAWGGGGSVVAVAGVAVTADTAAQLSVVQAVQEVLAGNCSTLPFQVFERVGEAKRPVRNHPLYRILHERPNPWQTAQEFRDEQTRHLVFERNCYAHILSDGSAPVTGLEPIHPRRILKIERGDGGRVYYTVAPIGVGPQQILRDDVIWHIRKAPLTENGLAGRPVYETGREELGRALAVEYYGARFFRNSGQGGGVLKHPGSFRNKQDRDDFWENWRLRTTGEAQHSDKLLTHGVDYVPVRLNNDEAQFIDTLKLCEVKVARLWQMPPHRVGILDRATNNNIEHQGIDYVVHTLAPWISGWEQAATRDLLVDQERDRLFCEFNVAGLLRGDIAARYRAYAAGRQWGWLSVNDIRRLENQEPIGPQGDRYLEPENMRRAGEGQRDNPQDGPDAP